MFLKNACKIMSTLTMLKFLEKPSSPQKKGKIILQCDEVWSFLGNKENQPWIWLALDVNTKKLLVNTNGKRGKSGAIG